jgi:threonylcarbamoyladenosine tRNA methylthiotransferase MtaB
VTRDAGHAVVPFGAAADVVVVNSCTITHDADADTRQLVRRAARGGARVVVTGCMASADPEALAAMPEVALILGNREKERFVELALGTGDGARVHVAAVDLTRRVRMTRLRPASDPRRSRAYLKIQDGCDYRCSFCIVPQVRGRSASLPVAEAAAQLRGLVAAGVPEVVLTGVHLGTYGRDLTPRTDLAGLVRALLPELGAARLRLGSVDPHEVDDELIAVFGDPRVCRHLHLPVQSGDDGVLRAMRRGHRADDLRRLVPRLVAAVPGMFVGTDVIAGFPGETPEAFAATQALLGELPLAGMHVFTYSERAGTAAATMQTAGRPRRTRGPHARAAGARGPARGGVSGGAGRRGRDRRWCTAPARAAASWWRSPTTLSRRRWSGPTRCSGGRCGSGCGPTTRCWSTEDQPLQAAQLLPWPASTWSGTLSCAAPSISGLASDQLVDPVLVALEDELVVHGEQHLGPLHAGQRRLDGDHGALHDVGGAALDRGVAGGCARRSCATRPCG